MSKTIWKFELQITAVQSISMPAGAEVLTIQMQKGVPCIWALVDPEAEKQNRSFEIFGTGNPVPEVKNRTYIGTFQSLGGALVFHCFEIIKL